MYWMQARNTSDCVLLQPHLRPKLCSVTPFWVEHENRNIVKLPCSRRHLTLATAGCFMHVRFWLIRATSARGLAVTLQMDDLLSRLSMAKDKISDTENLISIDLDHRHACLDVNVQHQVDSLNHTSMLPPFA